MAIFYRESSAWLEDMGLPEDHVVGHEDGVLASGDDSAVEVLRHVIGDPLPAMFRAVAVIWQRRKSVSVVMTK